MTKRELYRIKAAEPAKTRAAMWRLQKLLERTRASYAYQDFVKRSAAAKRVAR